MDSGTNNASAPGSVAIIGGGLAGCECAHQLAKAGIRTTIFEMRPGKRSQAHKTDHLAELVCSNSFRAASIENAVGLIKEEMRRLGSLIMEVADVSKVPAGGAHAVDRDRFAEGVTTQIHNNPNIQIDRTEITSLDADELSSFDTIVVATGPLTSEGLAADLVQRTDKERLYFYDAIAPVVEADSIDYSIVFAASRYGKGGDDYLNCPMDEPTYYAFIEELLAAEKIPLHEMDDPRFFPGCQPIEEIARQGPLSPAYGPMKPVGLTDPQTGKRPFAVVQLRTENTACTAYNLVGFQTRLKYPEQKRVLSQIPGLSEAVFLRMGSVHRNTYLDSPRILDDRLRLAHTPRIRFAGQITGVEGYVESTACGLLQGIFTAAELLGKDLNPPPPASALGSMLAHLRSTVTDDFQPSNIHWGHFPPLTGKLPRGRRGRRERRALMAERSLNALEVWRKSITEIVPQQIGEFER
ncbi:MAG: methylenetetrahydrofolate--tRNA-(uracil(54)-C(5))-methyltransferase (FADH(2)-oxidizing) TrmFO [Myxococcales bacterium]|nr:methylenetetrahydrofolate--tRNA-(uracil(54)-C(5))-methyltransferase (FADH(2)-oxidizing) TrmFO [Myxococcales bacterium]